MRTDVSRTGELDEDTIVRDARLIGVFSYFAAARVAVFASLPCPASGSMPEEPLFGRCLNLIEHALRLTLGWESDEGEVHYVCITASTLIFLNDFRKLLLPFLNLLEEPRFAHILAAWRGVEQSGLLQEMALKQIRDRTVYINESLADAQADKDAGVPLRACALPSCGAREAHVAHFKKCSACGQVVYCSKAHQTEHWPAHKAACKAARKAAAADKHDMQAAVERGGN